MIKYTVYFSKITSPDSNIYLWDTGVVDKGLQLYETKLELEDNTSGSFNFYIPPDHPYYDLMTIRDTIISIYRNGKWMWEGRVMRVEENFYKEKNVYCEGALAYLNDTIQEKKKYTYVTVRQLFQLLINYHNAKIRATYGDITIQPYNVLEVGYIRPDVSDREIEFEVDYESTMSFIKKLVDDYGGHVIITRDERTGRKYIEWKTDDELNHASQTIDFGVNLLDYSTTRELEDFCTVVMPLGSEIDEDEGVESSGKRITCANANNGSPYIISDHAKEYGWYESVLDCDGVTDPEELKRLGEEYMKAQFGGELQDLTLEVSAIDLAYLKHKDWA